MYLTLGFDLYWAELCSSRKVSLNDSNEILITEIDWKAMGVIVLTCCPGNGREMTQGSTEGHSPWNCTRASRLIIESVCVAGGKWGTRKRISRRQRAEGIQEGGEPEAFGRLSDLA